MPDYAEALVLLAANAGRDIPSWFEPVLDRQEPEYPSLENTQFTAEEKHHLLGVLRGEHRLNYEAFCSDYWLKNASGFARTCAAYLKAREEFSVYRRHERIAQWPWVYAQMVAEKAPFKWDGKWKADIDKGTI